MSYTKKRIWIMRHVSLGHIVRMKNYRKVEMVFKGTPEGRGSRGRPRLIWMNSVRICINLE